MPLSIKSFSYSNISVARSVDDRPVVRETSEGDEEHMAADVDMKEMKRSRYFKKKNVMFKSLDR